MDGGDVGPGSADRGQVRVGPARTAVLGVQVVGVGQLEMPEDRLSGDLDPGKAVGIHWTLIPGKG